ncbi:LLM class flavin-dependent oxidoreductase [Halioxenophilus sp. WMMB6]|uniref:LLM class flavin-dependent oxidoreductase n=1 Tax=Halioxenophilus sp. WMMB6 TaxID=3073815 RepID=UPI00295EB92C|nr:LLM class flavin-dependent oxidoreductase [Halioxenophilus sp. WMMB6]
MNKPLSFGYLYDFRNPQPWHSPNASLYAETLELITWTESLGFQGAWLPEHHCADDGYMPSPLVALSAIAAKTSRIKIGTAIALAPLYHPVKFAEDCAVLDIIADGRLEIALAIGYRRRETAAFGVDFTKRGQRFDEFLEIIQALWAGDTVTYAGKHFNVTEAAINPLPPRGKIPLYIGGFADKALERVAKYADGYFGNEEVCAAYLNKVKNLGKNPQKMGVRIQGLFYLVAHDPEKAMHELAPYYHYVNNAYSIWLNEDKASGADGILQQMSLEDFKKSGILQIDTPAKAIEKFECMRQSMPFEHFMMMRPPGLPVEKFQEYAEVFASHVLPSFNT